MNGRLFKWMNLIFYLEIHQFYEANSVVLN